MKKLRKLLALLLALMMVLSLVACGNNEVSNLGAENTTPASTDPEDIDDEEDVELPNIVVMFNVGSVPETETVEDIQAALNEITEEEIGVHVTLQYVSFADGATVFSSMLAADEQIDLFCPAGSTATSLATLTAQNQIVAMNEYLEEYAPSVLDLLSDYIAGTTFDGKIMGVSQLRELNESYWINLDADLLEELGLLEEGEACDSWTDFEALMAQVVELTDGTVYGIGPNDGNGSIITNYSYFVGEDSWSDGFWFDNLGDQNSFIYTDYETNTVQLYYETDYYMDAIQKVYSWMQEGLVLPDASTTEQRRDALISGGLALAYTGQAGPGNEISNEQATGHNLISVELGEAVVSASNVVKVFFCMPTTTREPEAAAKFLELMYTSSEVMNLLTWGIEGVDYVLNEEGEACFPEGVDASNARYNNSSGLGGNVFLTYPWEGQGGDYRETSYESLKNASVSKYLGVAVDTSSVENQVAACSTVASEYRKNLAVGDLDPDVYVQMFIDALYEAGMQDILDVYQAALDDFLAAQ